NADSNHDPGRVAVVDDTGDRARGQRDKHQQAEAPAVPTPRDEVNAQAERMPLQPRPPAPPRPWRAHRLAPILGADADTPREVQRSPELRPPGLRQTGRMGERAADETVPGGLAPTLASVAEPHAEQRQRRAAEAERDRALVARALAGDDQAFAA